MRFIRRVTVECQHAVVVARSVFLEVSGVAMREVLIRLTNFSRAEEARHIRRV